MKTITKNKTDLEKFLDWWNEKVKGNYITNSQFENLTEKFTLKNE